MKIFINKREPQITAEKLSFSTIVNYGLYSLQHFDRIAPTVTYRYPKQNSDTSLPAKSSIRIQDGMHFTVINGKRVERSSPQVSEPPTLSDAPRVRVKPEAIERRKAELAARGLDWPPTMTEEQRQAEVKRVGELLAHYEERHRSAQELKSSENASGEALLKDAYVIINILYEELVTAGMRTKGRQMAGRLLYSAGYAETVKKLENL